jgi:enamine deaminase RidA (YjgF/YER057c/UK114 family)
VLGLPFEATALLARLRRHFPAMALVEVTSLAGPQAVGEIEATAVVEGLDITWCNDYPLNA